MEHCHHRHHPKKNTNHHHSGDHQHSHKALERSRLKICLILTGSMMVIEFIGGFLTNSLSLLSDAAHMLTHSFALGISFFAMVFAVKSPSQKKSFGFYRIEILAALLNGTFLIVVAGYIFYKSFMRFINPQPIAVLQMLMIAVIGFIVNVACVFILHSVKKDDINVKGAFIHMLGDTASSISIIIGGIIIYFTNWYILDAILGIVIGIVIMLWAVGLLRDSVNILLESTPKHIDVCLIISAIENINGVRNIHDIHVWEITSKMYALTAHIEVDDIYVKQSVKILKDINKILNEKFDIEHTNIQFECYEEKTVVCI